MLGLLAAGYGAHCAHAQCQYEVAAGLEYPIDCAYGLPVITKATSMNRRGTVVGYYYCPLWEHYEGFRWTAEEGFTTLQRPAGVISAFPADINDDGVICGSMIVDPVGDRGFVYESGVWTVLPPVFKDAGNCHASAITNSGLVVGQRSIVDYGVPYNGFIWSRETGFLDLGVLSGPYSSAIAIAEDGTVVGWTGGSWTTRDAFMWQDGAITFLGAIPGGFTSEPADVTEDETIVGRGLVPMQGWPYAASRGFVWRRGQFTLIGTLPGHQMSGASGVSARTGQVVGTSSFVDQNNPEGNRGILWQNGTMTDLNALIPPGQGMQIWGASQVADDGTIRAYDSLNLRAVLLRPLDVPPGDLDLDCRVGVVDFLKLLAAWGPCPEGADCFADLNGDAVVDLTDFAILLDNWG